MDDTCPLQLKVTTRKLAAAFRTVTSEGAEVFTSKLTNTKRTGWTSCLPRINNLSFRLQRQCIIRVVFSSIQLVTLGVLHQCPPISFLFHTSCLPFLWDQVSQVFP